MKQLAAFLLFFSATVFAQTYSDVALQNSSSNYARVVPFAVVTVCASTDAATPCTNRITTYTDQTLTAPCTLISTISFGNSGGNGGPTSGTNCNNPGLADANGNFTVFAPVGLYRVCILSQNYVCLLKTIAAFTGGSSTITGSGTANTLPIWVNASTLGNSSLTDSGGLLTTTDTVFRFQTNSLGTITTIPATGTQPGGIRILGGNADSTHSAPNVQITGGTATGSGFSGASINLSAGSNSLSGGIGGSVNINTGQGATGPNYGKVNMTVDGGLGNSVFTFAQGETITGVTGPIYMQIQSQATPVSVQLISGSGTPSGNCPNSSPALYINAGASTASTVLYVCQANTWTAVTIP